MPAPVKYVVPWPENLPYTKQSITVPGTKRAGQTAHYRNSIWDLITVDTPNVLTTLTQAFDAGLELGRDREFLGYRPKISSSPDIFADHFVWETYGQVDVRRRRVGSGLQKLFKSGYLGGGDYETVGLWSQNRPEWQVVDLALHAYNKVGVSLYDTLGKDSVEYIIQHSHLTVIFVTAQHIPTLLKLAHKVPMLKLIVSIDDLSPETRHILSSWAQTVNIELQDLREFEAFGQANLTDVIPAVPDQVATICYTSGTTSNPKGVILRHRHLALATQANLTGLDLPAVPIVLSYLPLAHIYGRTTEIGMIALGGKIGYFTGDPLRLLSDAQLLKPNYFPSVPRVLNRVYQAAMAAGSAPGLKGALFRKAVQVKLDKLHATGDNTHAFWDRLVFRKISAVLGGNLVIVTSGSAPINTEVIDFLKIAFSCFVTEGDYGMTENAACCTKCMPNDPSSSGTVGPPQPVNELKLIDVPSMGYTSEDKPNPRGELCCRGANCFEEYYKDPKNTRETVDEEGWLHTGDVAEIDSCGRFKIIDRVKNIMKLAQGEYVALEKIENLYSTSPIVAQLYVHGDSLQSHLLAVVVPDPVAFSTLASEVTGKRIAAEDVIALEAAIKDERVKQQVLAVLDKEATRNSLKGFERIRRVHVTLVPFSVDNGTMTPTLKIRRKEAYALYKAELDGLYALGEPTKAGKL